MRAWRALAGSLLLLVALVASLAPGTAVRSAPRHAADGRRPLLFAGESGRGGGRAVATRSLSRLPLAFEPNRGQAPPGVSFLARASGYTVFLTASGLALSFPAAQARTPAASAQSVSPAPRAYPSVPTALSAPPAPTALSAPPPRLVTLRVVGAAPHVTPAGLERLPGVVNYILGKQPSAWHTGIPTYARVVYRDVRPGVSLVYYGTAGALEYDVVLARGADPTQVRLTVGGAQGVRLDRQGNLEVRARGTTDVLLQEAPDAYQIVGGRRRQVRARYVLAGPRQRQVGLRVGRYDARAPLVIDPVLRVVASGRLGSGAPLGALSLRYSTYWGGSGNDQGYGIAVDRAGRAYVVGATDSLNFPLQHGRRTGSRAAGRDHVFVTAFNPSGTAVLYTTYLGGRRTDIGFGIALDRQGNAVVVGRTASPDFPVRDALQAGYGGDRDAFVTKLNPRGVPVYSTYLGGSDDDEAAAVAVDGAGNAYVAGSTASLRFPLRQAWQKSYGGDPDDAFVARLSATGRLVYSTYLGGNNGDLAFGIAVDRAGNAYVTGVTDSTTFPVRHAVQGRLAGETDAFVAKLNAAGALVYSTYLGGEDTDEGHAIAVDKSGAVYVTGLTASTDFPLRPPLQGSLGGENSNAFIAKLDAAGRLSYSTYLGGEGSDEGNGIAVDTLGDAYITGSTLSPNFPLKHALRSSHYAAGPAFRSRPTDAFVTILNPAGAALVFSSYLGGNGEDDGQGIAVDSRGNAYITGTTTSSDFPVKDALQPRTGGGTCEGHPCSDAFVVKIGRTP